jgi:glutamate--cysteine ligase
LCEDSLNETKHNQAMTAKQGRDPDFKLQRDGDSVGLSIWAGEILDKVMAIAECIDRQEGCASYAEAVGMMQGLVANPDETPSARVLEKLRSENCSFFEFALSLAEGNRDYFAAITPLSDARQAQFTREASESIVRQTAIETSDSISLDEYLATYFSSGS